MSLLLFYVDVSLGSSRLRVDEAHRRTARAKDSRRYVQVDFDGLDKPKSFALAVAPDVVLEDTLIVGLTR